MATIVCNLFKVTFFNSLLPKNEPVIPARVAQITKFRLSIRPACVKRVA